MMSFILNGFLVDEMFDCHLEQTVKVHIFAFLDDEFHIELLLVDEMFDCHIEQTVKVDIFCIS